MAHSTGWYGRSFAALGPRRDARKLIVTRAAVTDGCSYEMAESARAPPFSLPDRVKRR